MGKSLVFCRQRVLKSRKYWSKRRRNTSEAVAKMGQEIAKLFFKSF